MKFKIPSLFKKKKKNKQQIYFVHRISFNSLNEFSIIYRNNKAIYFQNKIYIFLINIQQATQHFKQSHKYYKPNLILNKIRFSAMAHPSRAAPEGERSRLDKSREDMLQRMDKPWRHGARRANREGKNPRPRNPVAPARNTKRATDKGPWAQRRFGPARRYFGLWAGGEVKIENY